MVPSFRLAREEDLERIVDIHAAAFPDPRGRDARRRNFVQNVRGRLEDLHLATVGGVVVAHGFLFRLDASFGGRLVPSAGIASVGVAPEARGRGIGTTLVSHLHEVARRDGRDLAILHAFRQGFYSRLGYGPVTPYVRLRFHPGAIPFGVERPIRRAGGNDAAAMHVCWEEEALRHSGALSRASHPAVWDARLTDEGRTWMVAEGDGGVEGYVAWTLIQREPHADVVLRVTDLAARTPAAWRSLWGIISAQRDQVTEVQVDTAQCDPIVGALVDADRDRSGTEDLEHGFGDLAGGPLVRLLDVPRALSARGYPVDGSLVLAIEDVHIELDVIGGRGRVVPTDAPAELQMTRPTLAAIAFGAMPVSAAARIGWVRARDDRALAIAGALLALPPYFSQDPF